MTPPTTGGHHVFQVFGQNDTFAPPITQYIYAKGVPLGVMVHDTSVTTPDYYMPNVESQAALTKNSGGRLTAVVRQYAPPAAGDGGAVSYDGHFVAFHNATAQRDVNRFLNDLAKGLAPTVAP